MKVITKEERIEFITNLLKYYQTADLEGTSLAYEAAKEQMWNEVEEYYNKLFGKDEK